MFVLATVLALFASSTFAQTPEPRIVFTAPFVSNWVFGGYTDYHTQYVNNEMTRLANAGLQWQDGDVIQVNYGDFTTQFFTVYFDTASGLYKARASSSVLNQAGAGGSWLACSPGRVVVQGYWRTWVITVDGEQGNSGRDFIVTGYGMEGGNC